MKSITRYLSIYQNKMSFVLYAMVAASGIYFCMYAFRKPFTVATFDGLQLWGMHYKVILILAQVAGYAMSKFIGIKLISGLKPEKRARCILLFILLAQVALLGFALTPTPYNVVFMFLNGVPLGMIWGLVFSYLEGRITTELLALGLSVSFIFSSGFVKTVGKYLMLTFDVSEMWMPFVVGLLFLVPLIVCVYLIEQLPPPNDEDIEIRVKRVVMTKHDRRKLTKILAPLLWALIPFYFVTTAFRDLRDNFTSDIWSHLGFTNTADIFTKSETPTVFVILIVLALMYFIKNNKKAVNYMLILFGLGMLMVGSSTYLFEYTTIITPMQWMTIQGCGLFMCYVPFGCMFFERIVAMSELKGNAGFLIYLADSFGYLGSVLVLLYKEFFHSQQPIFNFYISFSYVLSACGLICVVYSLCYVYFTKKQPVSELKYQMV